jgi:hypothetical protein
MEKYREPQKVKGDGFNLIQQRWLFSQQALETPELVLWIDFELGVKLGRTTR